ncbi:sensor histidine kinase [Flexibacterium corallicola]|uniref:sensor histidine kinase n=1 Tax=Flexibacterium corallicola TaxID=3037259 RepID=UPI00286EFF3C|nr:ATP-binding protein [Pseudovibrio sp. M1P-2-3]
MLQDIPDRLRSRRKRPTGMRKSLSILSTVFFFVVTTSGWAQSSSSGSFLLQETSGLFQLFLVVCTIASILVACGVSIFFVRYQRRQLGSYFKMEEEVLSLRTQAQQLQNLVESEGTLIVLWKRLGQTPVLTGQMNKEINYPIEPAEFLKFPTWLEHQSARELKEHLEALFESATPFTVSLVTQEGIYLEATGKAVGGMVVLRLRDLSGDQRRGVRLDERNRGLEERLTTLRTLLNAQSGPAWQRDPNGKLIWANDAYVDAVEERSLEDTLEKSAEFLDERGRRRVAMMRGTDGVFNSPLSVVAAGERRVFDITDVKRDSGSAGLAFDVSELETVQKQLRRTLGSHRRTLEELQTAVAIFGPDQKLQFYNSAYRELWKLDPRLLEATPLEGEILDSMRANRNLPEQADYQSWREKHLRSYQSLEANDFWWYLPDGRTIRVIANPHPQGGVTYIYENVTERLDLESRYNALTRVQGETLDNLSEAVAVFGSNGRLRLRNPAFEECWNLSAEDLKEVPHLSQLIGECQKLFPEDGVWQDLSGSITGLIENRRSLSGRMERLDGSVVDYVTVPLPDGGTLLTFVNVTDSVNVERALVEKNDALQEADQLKNTFVQHVSYELRSPLTTIIGFAQLLSDPKFGSLSAKQSEYTDYILSSSASLLAIINDILDLTTIDAGIMELDLGSVDIAGTVFEAIEGLKDRIDERKISLETHLPQGIGGFKADGRRVRQVLFNLLSNAIGYSEKGGVVAVSSWRENDGVFFRVEDKGTGIPEHLQEKVFSRFVSRGTDEHRQGVGLGLSIVKSFVELHSGTVEITSKEGVGTTVTCRFPLEPEIPKLRAAE